MMKYNTLITVFLFLSFVALIGCKAKNEKTKDPISPVSDKVTSAIPEQNISIHEAALNGQLSQITRLLQGGSDFNAQDQDGCTALMYASFNGHIEIIKTLIEKGANVNLQDSYGRTALMMASSGPYPEAVKMLLDHQADPNITDTDEHFSALMYAAAEGQLDNVKILLSYKADPSLKDIDGDNAIAFAAKNGHKEVVALLKSLKK
jgi:ankyrin repeat protein